MYIPVIDRFQRFLIKTFGYLHAAQIKNLIVLFTGLFLGVLFLAFDWIDLWFKAHVDFTQSDELEKTKLVANRVQIGDEYTTYLRLPSCKLDLWNIIIALYVLRRATLKSGEQKSLQLKDLNRTKYTVWSFCTICALIVILGVLMSLDIMLPRS